MKHAAASFAETSRSSGTWPTRLHLERSLEQLGIDLNKEADAFEYAPVDDGCHLYGGWFVFAGELVTAGERNATAADSH